MTGTVRHPQTTVAAGAAATDHRLKVVGTTSLPPEVATVKHPPPTITTPHRPVATTQRRPATATVKPRRLVATTRRLPTTATAHLRAMVPLPPPPRTAVTKASPRLPLPPRTVRNRLAPTGRNRLALTGQREVTQELQRPLSLLSLGGIPLLLRPRLVATVLRGEAVAPRPAPTTRTADKCKHRHVPPPSVFAVPRYTRAHRLNVNSVISFFGF
mmetsp:Transcript_21034/g.23418  ORF Transcript_21034/g.23418 Transcript_21034/m.23418 type:complete len:214 (-) Transcript_21034:7-648(-)